VVVPNRASAGMTMSLFADRPESARATTCALPADAETTDRPSSEGMRVGVRAARIFKPGLNKLCCEWYGMKDLQKMK